MFQVSTFQFAKHSKKGRFFRDLTWNIKNDCQILSSIPSHYREFRNRQRTNLFASLRASELAQPKSFPNGVTNAHLGDTSRKGDLRTLRTDIQRLNFLKCLRHKLFSKTAIHGRAVSWLALSFWRQIVECTLSSWVNFVDPVS